MNFTKRNHFTLASLLCACAIIGMLAVFALPARAQVAVKPAIYPLTNSGLFSLSFGTTNIAGSGSATINSQPFPIWRGRGFAVHSSFVGTNAGTDALTYTFQFATPASIGGALTTNWTTYGTVAVAAPMNGNTTVFFDTNAPSSLADNFTLGRLQTIANAHASGVIVNVTNTYVSVIP